MTERGSPQDPTEGETHSLTGEGVGGPNSDEWTESLELGVLCVAYVCSVYCRNIRLTEGNVKNVVILKIDLQKELCGRCLSVWGPERPPLNAVYVYTVYLLKQGRGKRGRVESKRRLEGQQFTKLGRKYHMTDCISSLYTLINTYRKVPLQVNFV